ncbi:MAG: type II toxin-antitoxin system HicB family antitoxin [Candidatus Omnitrophica bacterium]|nr:type II toxin-antitoxin system HicB family antitoxin [Candidatus Omnitrophota bacterium]
MKKTKFKVFLEYDPEYQGFVAEVLSLPGCMSQGKSEEEAIQNIEEAIKGYLKVLREKHKTVPSEEVRYVEVGI